jgi:hypothetical protein
MNEAQSKFLEDLQAKKSRGVSKDGAVADATAKDPSESFLDEMGKNLVGQLEMAGMVITGAVASPVSKIADIMYTPIAGVEAGTEIGKGVAESLTYMPQTERGQQFAQATGEALQPITEFFQTGMEAGAKGIERATGSEMIGEMAKDVVSLTPDILALGAVKALKPNVVLKQNGQPTPALKQILNKQGLTYEALTPEAQAAIPDTLPPALIDRAQQSATGKAVTKKEIEAGGRQAGLADKQVTPGGKLKTDPLGAEAVRQGWDEGFVAAIKSANPATQAEMLKQLAMYERIKANKAAAAQGRPSDIAGQSVTQRINFIKKKVEEANAAKNKIAREKFPGMSVDVAPVAQRLQSALKELDVRLLPDQNGVLRVPEFRGSVIQADRAAQRMIKDALDLMNSAKRDAAGLHRLKLQFDNLIDYGRSQQKLTPSGEGVVRGLRNEINTVLRTLDPDYAKANDIVSRGLETFENLRKSAGTQVDIYADTASKAVGQQLRRLFSNTQARVNLEDTVKLIDDFADELGGSFNTSAYDLSLFANNLDRKFGAVAETSLQGVMEAANIAQNVARGDIPGVAAQGARFVKDRMDAARGVNEFTAYRTLEELLKRGAGK